MKTWRYKLGHDAKTTLTVAELISKLKEYPDDMPVLCQWESVKGAMQNNDYDFIVTKNYHCGEPEDSCDVLEIDVNSY